MKDFTLAGLGLIISAAVLMFITVGWWLRVLHLSRATLPEDLVAPLLLAFVSGVVCAVAALTVGDPR